MLKRKFRKTADRNVKSSAATNPSEVSKRNVRERCLSRETLSVGGSSQIQFPTRGRRKCHLEPQTRIRSRLQRDNHTGIERLLLRALGLSGRPLLAVIQRPHRTRQLTVIDCFNTLYIVTGRPTIQKCTHHQRGREMDGEPTSHLRANQIDTKTRREAPITIDRAVIHSYGIDSE
jgi:hypothetical protein